MSASRRKLSPENGVLLSAAQVTAMVLLFKILGFVKQAFVASYFGATEATDIYFLANGFVLAVSEAIVKALGVSIIAVYTNLRITKGREAAAKLVNGLLTAFMPAFLGLALLLILFAPKFAHLLAPSFSGESFSELVRYTRILSPILLFTCFETILAGVFDSYKSFFIPRLQSLIYSLAVIAACVFLSKPFGVSALVIGQYASSAVFIAVLIIKIRNYHSFALVRIDEVRELKSIFHTAVPLIIGNSALQINQIVDNTIASGLSAGAASALSYCQVLEQFVSNIMIVNIGNVMFANFAEFVAKGEKNKIKDTLAKAIDLLICILVGVSVVTVICAEDIVSIVYYRGNFTREAVYLTAAGLIGYAIAFVAVAVRDLSVKCLYAFQDTRAPMIACVAAVLVNIILSITLSRFLGILGITLATSISAALGMIINALFLKKYINDYDFGSHLMTLLKCLPAAAFLALVCKCLQSVEGLSSIGRFFLCAVPGLMIYMLLLYGFRIAAVNDLFKSVKSFIRR